jgi:hypothetical protein
MLSLSYAYLLSQTFQGTFLAEQFSHYEARELEHHLSSQPQMDVKIMWDVLRNTNEQTYSRFSKSESLNIQLHNYCFFKK